MVRIDTYAKGPQNWSCFAPRVGIHQVQGGSKGRSPGQLLGSNKFQSSFSKCSLAFIDFIVFFIPHSHHQISHDEFV